MSEIELAFDWLDADGVQGPELRATWAKFTLRVGGRSVTRVLHEPSRTTRDHVYLPLYPLAEWLATHWWVLFYEVDTPRKLGDRAFAMRHSLRDAREGYALPPLSILPQGETVRLVWEQEELPHHRLEFLTRGQKDLPTPILRGVLSGFIQAVVRRLQELTVEGTMLEEEWGAIESVGAEEAEFCTAAAALGLDPYALEDDQRDEIASIGDGIPASLRSEFFTVANLSHLGEESKAVLDALEAGRTNSANLDAIKELQLELAAATTLQASAAPWKAGYAIARGVRRHLDLDSQPLPSLPAISKALRTKPSELDKAIQRTPAPTPLFDALVGLNDQGSPGFVVSSRREESRRFHLCRGIFEFLTDATLEAALLTEARSDRQARSRAFAAEFLAPADGLRRRVSGQTVTADEVDELAAEFGVSPWVILHQLENHEISRVAV
jgi:hypothetical protein